MKTLTGALLVGSGILLGLYFGIFWGLYGGIVLALESFKAEPMQTNMVVWGIVRALLFETWGGLASILPILFGFAILHD